MSPRAYKLGQRQVAAEETRNRIVAAAREILAAESPAGFTVDAVARQASVARMTVYYQFESKRGVLEALFDDLANRGLMPGLRPVFHEPDPSRALDGVIGAFATFWNSDRIVLRRARALAALDHEFEASMRGRDEMRRGHLRKILERLYAERKPPPARPIAASIDILHMLTSFETFDALLTGARTFEEATAILRKLAAAVIAARP
jgi:AcrR family transcriptional regulator